MGDIFHEQVPERIYQADTTGDCRQRGAHLPTVDEEGGAPSGFSGVTGQRLDRGYGRQQPRSLIKYLKEVRTPVRSISLEPLLEALPNLGEQLRENGVNWVIVGGESGTQARRLELSWIRDLIEECKGQEIPVFVKQLGTRWERENEGTSGKGEETEGWPEELKLRQYPEGADYLKEQGA